MDILIDISADAADFLGGKVTVALDFNPEVIR
jgi:hypothetical protein